ncbi:hypothetical protein FA13DRAFT_1625428 [Coprinellus micaceus]|uniref:Putative gamma-glutamylcyclotransferase n=1 Tax=Coprinellus micaceus TaxID=71717 RepID=A0A4Y7TMK5_COPMI|nr:hypothetical protein FA13DRAFT_1625428 [Coprinellus micaceus]
MSTEDVVDPSTIQKKAFFYGTLMHPRTLKQILQNNGEHLRFCPAVLIGYARHKVKGQTYPGIITLSQSESILGMKHHSLQESVVRGTLVEGLTEADLKRLDDFEDTEYARETLTIHPLAPFEPLSTHAEQDDEIIRMHATPLSTEAGLTFGVQVDTYVYRMLERLDPGLWMFDDFVQNHAAQWFNYVPMIARLRSRQWYENVMATGNMITSMEYTDRPGQINESMDDVTTNR